MYSMLLRYHWLLKEEKWCIELSHCSETPAWQRWQALDCMKYFDGMFPPCLVWAELGKNFPLGPSPSPSMVSGGISGFAMRFALCHASSRVHQAPAAIPAVNSSSATNPNPRRAIPLPSHPRDASHDANMHNAPVMHIAMWAYSQDFK